MTITEERSTTTKKKRGRNGGKKLVREMIYCAEYESFKGLFVNKHTARGHRFQNKFSTPNINAETEKKTCVNLLLVGLFVGATNFFFFST